MEPILHPQRATISLDELDCAILYQLDHNSRQPVAELSKRLNLMRDRVSYRIKRLTEAGILRTFVTTVNPYKYGLVIYKMYLRLQNNKARIHKLIAALKAHPQVYWVAECDGKWDLMFAVFARHPFEFRRLQDELLSGYSDLVTNYGVYTLVNAQLFRKSYLLGRGSQYVSLGGLPSEISLDDFDFRLLKILANNARLSVTELARRLKSSPRIVQYRISQLEAAQVIVGYRIELEPASLGMSFFKAQLQMGAVDLATEERILEYCRSNPHITYLIRQIGDCMVELELEVMNYQQFNEIMAHMRSKFAGVINDIESISIRTQYYRL